LIYRGQVNDSGFEHGHDTPDVRRGFLRSSELFILTCPDALHQIGELEAFQHPAFAYNTSLSRYIKLPQFITYLIADQEGDFLGKELTRIRRNWEE